MAVNIARGNRAQQRDEEARCAPLIYLGLVALLQACSVPPFYFRRPGTSVVGYIAAIRGTEFVQVVRRKDYVGHTYISPDPREVIEPKEARIFLLFYDISGQQDGRHLPFKIEEVKREGGWPVENDMSAATEKELRRVLVSRGLIEPVWSVNTDEGTPAEHIKASEVGAEDRAQMKSRGFPHAWVCSRAQGEAGLEYLAVVTFGNKAAAVWSCAEGVMYGRPFDRELSQWSVWDYEKGRIYVPKGRLDNHEVGVIGLPKALDVWSYRTGELASFELQVPRMADFK